LLRDTERIARRYIPGKKKSPILSKKKKGEGVKKRE